MRRCLFVALPGATLPLTAPDGKQWTTVDYLDFQHVVTAEAITCAFGAMINCSRLSIHRQQQQACITARNWLRTTLSAIEQQICGHRSSTLRSSWHLTELAQCNSLTRPFYRNLVIFFTIDAVLSRTHYDGVVFHGGESDLTTCLLSRCAQLDIPAQATNEKQIHRTTPVRALLTRWHVLVTMAVNWIGLKKLSKKYLHKTPKNSPHIHLFSDGPRQWRQGETMLYDRYWRDLPHELARKNIEYRWIISLFSSEQYYPSMTFKAHLEKLEKIVQENKNKVVISENFLTRFDFLKAGIEWDSWRLYRFLHRHSPTLFQWNGLSLSPLFLNMISETIHCVPIRRLVARATAHALNEFSNPLFLTYLFEFAVGKGIIAEARQRVPDITIWGMQHGPITPGKVFYETLYNTTANTTPDRLLVDGDFAAEQLRAVYPTPEAIDVFGALRFTPPLKPARRAKRHHGNSRTVVVAPGLHDTLPTVRFVTHALAHHPDVNVVFKPHPLVTRNARTLLDTLDQAERYSITDSDIDSVLHNADIVIVSYSTVGFEALAAGIPVVEIRPCCGIDFGLFAAIPGVVPYASSPEELRTLLDVDDWGIYYDGHGATELCRRCFHDGGALERYIAAIQTGLDNINTSLYSETARP